MFRKESVEIIVFSQVLLDRQAKGTSLAALKDF
jgi:hypothetical protein